MVQSERGALERTGGGARGSAAGAGDGKPARLQASGRRRGTAGCAWPPARTQPTGMMAPTTACGLPAPLSGRRLARGKKIADWGLDETVVYAFSGDQV